MKKKISVLMLFAILITSAFASTAPLNVESTIPISADGGALDYFATRSLTMDYCNEYILASSIVTSPSNSTPDSVLAEINGVNHTMKAPLFLIDGDSNGKSFDDGITYYTVLDEPVEGQYNLTIHVTNSSGTYSTALYQNNYNQTLAVESAFSFSNTFQVDAYEYLFMMYTEVETVTCIEEIILTIDGVNKTMNRNPLWLYQYTYQHAFDEVDEDTLVSYNFTIVYDGGSEFKSGSTINLNAPSNESEITNIDVEETYGDTLEMEIGLTYFDGSNRPLQGLIVSVNGTNTTLSHEPKNKDFFGTLENNLAGAIYSRNVGGIIKIGEEISIFTLNLEYEKFYNISFWYNNGTWNEYVWITNQQIDPKPANIAEPTVEITASKVTIDEDKMYVTSNLTITSDVANFQLEDDTEIDVDIWAPERQTSGSFEEVDGLDTDFSDGKVYTLNKTLWSDGRDFWGNVVLNVSISYGNDSDTIDAPYNQMNVVDTIIRIAGFQGTYKVKAGDFYSYLNTVKEKLCCGDLITTQSAHSINFTKVEYYQGTDLFEYTQTLYLISNHSVLERDPILQTETQDCVNLDLNGEQLMDMIVFPTEKVDEITEYINDFPLDAENAVISSQFLTGLIKIEYSQEIGALRYEFSTTVDKNGILRERITRKYLNDELIYEAVTTLEIGILDVILTDYIWYIVIGGAVILIGVVILIKRK